MNDESAQIGQELTELFAQTQPSPEMGGQQQVDGQEEQREAEEGPEQSAGDTQQDDDRPLEYVSDVWDELGLPEHSYYDLRLKSGKEKGKTYTLGELKDLADRAHILEEQRAQVEKERQELQRLQQQAKVPPTLPQGGQQPGAPQQASQGLQEVLQRMEALKLNYAQIDWKQEEQDDPGEAALLRQKYQEAMQTLNHTAAQLQQQEAEQQRQYISYQQSRILREVDGWDNADTQKAEMALIYETAAKYGFTPEAIDQVLEPAAMRVWRDFAKLRSQVANANATAKKVVKQGNPILRSSALRGKQLGRQINELTRRARETKSKHDIHEAEKALLKEAGVI